MACRAANDRYAKHFPIMLIFKEEVSTRMRPGASFDLASRATCRKKLGICAGWPRPDLRAVGMHPALLVSHFKVATMLTQLVVVAGSTAIAGLDLAAIVCSVEVLLFVSAEAGGVDSCWQAATVTMTETRMTSRLICMGAP